MLLILTSCFFTSDEKVRRGLEVICKSDLNQIIKDTDKSKLQENPRYEIVQYKTFDPDSSVFTVLATVDYHYMDLGTEVNYKIVRKYRYHYVSKKWQRFYNEFQSMQYE